MRSIANALSKESGRPQRPETQSDHQAVINVLKCCREMLSDPDLLDVKTENKKNLQQFLVLLRVHLAPNTGPLKLVRILYQ